MIEGDFERLTRLLAGAVDHSRRAPRRLRASGLDPRAVERARAALARAVKATRPVIGAPRTGGGRP